MASAPDAMVDSSTVFEPDSGPVDAGQETTRIEWDSGSQCCASCAASEALCCVSCMSTCFASCTGAGTPWAQCQASCAAECSAGGSGADAGSCDSTACATMCAAFGTTCAASDLTECQAVGACCDVGGDVLSCGDGFTCEDDAGVQGYCLDQATGGCQLGQRCLYGEIPDAFAPYVGRVVACP